MKLELTDVLYALSFALDAVEKEVTGAQRNHGMRVAFLCALMGEKAGLSGEELRDFIGCAILHDNALAEYLREQYGIEITNGGDSEKKLLQKIKENDKKAILEAGTSHTMHQTARHCIIGEKRIEKLPFRTDVKNVILYHHENADGTGPLQQTEEETNIKSEILHLADQLDVLFELKDASRENYKRILAFVNNKNGSWFSRRSVELLKEAVGYEEFCQLSAENPKEYLRKHIPYQVSEYSEEEIKNIASFFAEIVDYKSSFTKTHSVGVANTAEKMARYYGWSEDKVIKYYFAGAMHDIGKLVVSNDILEKPDRLTDQEFSDIKHHAAVTYYILHQMHGMEEITEWASNHHEKLDGTGYSRGLTADQMSFEDKLMGCVDIYQALTEDRPYKKKIDHRKTIDMMRKMAEENKIDRAIVEDMDRCMGADFNE